MRIRKVLVCGGCNYKNRTLINSILSGLNPLIVINGGSSGAAVLSTQWALDNDRDTELYLPDYTRHGENASYARNKRMIEKSDPDIVVAFPGGKNTEHTVQLAIAAGYAVIDLRFTAQLAQSTPV